MEEPRVHGFRVWRAWGGLRIPTAEVLKTPNPKSLRFPKSESPKTFRVSGLNQEPSQQNNNLGG